jgi:hypothetical protein
LLSQMIHRCDLDGVLFTNASNKATSLFASCSELSACRRHL